MSDNNNSNNNNTTTTTTTSTSNNSSNNNGNNVNHTTSSHPNITISNNNNNNNDGDDDDSSSTGDTIDISAAFAKMAINSYYRSRNHYYSDSDDDSEYDSDNYDYNDSDYDDEEVHIKPNRETIDIDSTYFTNTGIANYITIDYNHKIIWLEGEIKTILTGTNPYSCQGWSEDGDLPTITVKNVGLIKYPISKEQIDQLIAVSNRELSSKETETTITDLNVGKVWHIESSDISFNGDDLSPQQTQDIINNNNNNNNSNQEKNVEKKENVNINTNNNNEKNNENNNVPSETKQESNNNNNNNNNNPETNVNNDKEQEKIDNKEEKDININKKENNKDIKEKGENIIQDSKDEPNEQVSIKSWQDYMDELLIQVKDDLGLDDDLEIKMDFNKMLVCEVGGFFLSDHVFRKTDKMFGTLIISLPCPHKGGELILEHAGKSVIVQLDNDTATKAHYCAFYADCKHLITKVTEGYRVCLVYNLVRCDGDNQSISSPPTLPKKVADLAGYIRDIFNTANQDTTQTLKKQLAPGYYDNLTRIVYVLDHIYPRPGFTPNLLKGNDIALVKLLVSLAKVANIKVTLGNIVIEEKGDYQYGEYIDGEFTYKLSEIKDLNGETLIHYIEFDPELELLPQRSLMGTIPYEADVFRGAGTSSREYTRLYRRSAVILWDTRHRNKHYIMDFESSLKLLGDDIKTKRETILSDLVDEQTTGTQEEIKKDLDENAKRFKRLCEVMASPKYKNMVKQLVEFEFDEFLSNIHQWKDLDGKDVCRISTVISRGLGDFQQSDFTTIQRKLLELYKEYYMDSDQVNENIVTLFKKCTDQTAFAEWAKYWFSGMDPKLYNFNFSLLEKICKMEKEKPNPQLVSVFPSIAQSIAEAISKKCPMCDDTHICCEHLLDYFDRYDTVIKLFKNYPYFNDVKEVINRAANEITSHLPSEDPLCHTLYDIWCKKPIQIPKKDNNNNILEPSTFTVPHKLHSFGSTPNTSPYRSKTFKIDNSIENIKLTNKIILKLKFDDNNDNNNFGWENNIKNTKNNNNNNNDNNMIQTTKTYSIEISEFTMAQRLNNYISSLISQGGKADMKFTELNRLWNYYLGEGMPGRLVSLNMVVTYFKKIYLSESKFPSEYGESSDCNYFVSKYIIPVLKEAHSKHNSLVSEVLYAIQTSRYANSRTHIIMFYTETCKQIQNIWGVENPKFVQQLNAALAMFASPHLYIYAKENIIPVSQNFEYSEEYVNSKFKCTCEHCANLKIFLMGPEIIFQLKSKNENRQHVENKAYLFHVDCQTLGLRAPYILQIEKSSIKLELQQNNCRRYDDALKLMSGYYQSI